MQLLDLQRLLVLCCRPQSCFAVMDVIVPSHCQAHMCKRNQMIAKKLRIIKHFT